MLERTKLIADLLDHGVRVFAFETDQVWLADPVPYIRSDGFGLLQGMDVVGALDSKREIGGNLLLLNPTLTTRRLWRMVVAHFAKSIQDEKDKNTPFKYIANDQSILTQLIFYDPHLRDTDPVQFRSLSIDLIADGLWYNDYHTHGLDKHDMPIIINNNFIRGISEKTKRLQKFGQWFLSEGQCDPGAVHSMVNGSRFAPEPGLSSLAEFVAGVAGHYVESDKRTKVFYENTKAVVRRHRKGVIYKSTNHSHS
eukprot:Plantae.Rhodophyta-Rhodochaete_pulchella.ctg13466.p2 GENE.Plantae.Rhodophyta-Rhodochaete_pulchella.ctg13466~~Plantae.Rhodophyta-Rhodochaete_pulchella.ctg13466.p2  ORF type:complete len:253 (+),score=34.00 Plantae.Rhodophyta-Rhodochaete_pulchella.ctg13466:583-1341(+)